MNWEEARRSALSRWHEGRNLAGRCTPREFIDFVRDRDALCVKALREAERIDDADDAYCRYCASYEQYGGCHSLIDAMCDAASFKDWDTAHQLTSNMIGMLENLEFGEEQVTESWRPALD